MIGQGGWTWACQRDVDGINQGDFAITAAAIGDAIGVGIVIGEAQLENGGGRSGRDGRGGNGQRYITHQVGAAGAIHRWGRDRHLGGAARAQLAAKALAAGIAIAEGPMNLNRIGWERGTGKAIADRTGGFVHSRLGGIAVEQQFQ